MELLNEDPKNMTCEKRMDALAEVLAEGLFYLSQNGPEAPLTSMVEEGNPSLIDGNKEGGGDNGK